jgi:hypothetical protein
MDIAKMDILQSFYLVLPDYQSPSSPKTPYSDEFPKLKTPQRGQLDGFKKESAVVEFVDKSNCLPMVATSKLAQRNISLSACGFAFTATEFEKKLTR